MTTNINASISLNDEDLANLVVAIEGDLTERIKNEIAENGTVPDIDEKIESWIEENLDIDDTIDDRISHYMDYNFDLDNHLSNVNLSDYIDTDNSIDEGEVQSLLNSYSPGNGCSTGNAFTDALARGFKYIAHHYEGEVKPTIAWIMRDELKTAVDAAVSSFDIKSIVKESIAEVFVEMFAPKTQPVIQAVPNDYPTVWSAKTAQ